jgi:DNA polymerase V
MYSLRSPGIAVKKLILVNCGISGFESPASEYTELTLSLDEALIDHPNATFLAYAQGNSMLGIGIHDGDVLVCDRAVTPRQNDPVVVALNGELCCKLLDIRGRRLLSAHPACPPVAISETDQLSVEAVITRSIRCHRPSPVLR